eukprot:scaffold1934_cov72-Skeletonema_dohrnii-CCMP3373.AAC.1
MSVSQWLPNGRFEFPNVDKANLHVNNVTKGVRTRLDDLRLVIVSEVTPFCIECQPGVARMKRTC